MPKFCSTSILINVNKRHGAVTGSRGSTFQTDTNNLEQSSWSKKLIHRSQFIRCNDPRISRSCNTLHVCKLTLWCGRSIFPFLPFHIPLPIPYEVGLPPLNVHPSNPAWSICRLPQWEIGQLKTHFGAYSSSKTQHLAAISNVTLCVFRGLE